MLLTVRNFLLAPERVDERLTSLAGKDINGGHAPTRRTLDSVQAEFLEATKPRPVASRSFTGTSRTPQHIDVQEVSSSSIHSRTGHRSSDLPLDVFLEIASCVAPLDLIHLAQTSKPLRRLLMSKKSRAIWREVLGNVLELPPCPSDIDEPLYAALVFSQRCFECSANGAFWVDYALRLRMCEQCYKDNVVEGTEVLKSVPQPWRDKVCEVVLMLVPSANTFDFADLDSSFDRVSPLTHLRQDFYFKPELEAMLGLFWPLPAPEDIAALKPLVRARVNYIIVRQTHAVLVHAWDNRCDVLASGNDDFEFPEIKDTFDDPAYYKLCGPGWDETSLYEDPAFAHYLSSKTCQDSEPELEDQDPPKPPHQLTMERRLLEQRDHIGREARVRGRFAQVAEWHQAILALPEFKDVDRAELPNSYAESKMWESRVLADDARGPLNYSHDHDAELEIDVDIHSVRDIVQTLLEYPGRVKRALAEMLEFTEACRADGLCFELGAGSDEDDEREVGEEARKVVVKYRLSDSDSVDQLTKDAEGTLLRPTALFECLECGGGPHAYPEINVHWQREHWDKSVWMDHSGDSDAYGAAVWDEGIDVAERILAVLSDKGLLEDERDMRRLDELVGEGRVFCACGDPDMETPKEGLSWAELVNHFYIHLNDNVLRTKTLTMKTTDVSMGDIPVWLDDHDLASCMKYLPDGADTSEASNRVTADEATRERIEALLSQCPEESLPACRLCEVLMQDDKKDDTLFLTENVDGVFYHMQAKHGKEVEEKDIVFWEESIFDKALETADL